MQEASQEAVVGVGLSHLIDVSGGPTAPLCVLVHGRAGDRKVMLAFRRTIPPSWNVLSVEAPHPDPLGGKSWWLVEGGVRLSTEGAVAGYERFRDGVARALQFYSLSPVVVFGLGFSQGAGVLSIALQRGDPHLRGVALLAGFVVPLGDTSTSGSELIPARVFIAHGTRDQVVPIEEARRGMHYLTARGCEVEMVEDDVEHKVGAQGMRRLKEWLGSFPCSRMHQIL